ncbi:MAG: hypothetical protein ICCCNLDF_00363 [Planctomycetes bacterium]|nr:hypothetical protein [Planctomycetota bacterium]
MSGLTPIIIAAPSANCGKTELACRMIRALDGAQALKITRFHRESHCPVHGVNEQGEDNCDGCAPAPAGFELVDDPAVLRTPGKDSDRMLQAGADPVLWLRAAPHVFEYALKAALKHFDPARPLVLEGNSAATVAEFAGTVVLLWPQRTRGVKASVLPALKRATFLVLVEASEGPPRRWPKSLRSAMARVGVSEADLPTPVWLPAEWWKQTETTAEHELLQALKVTV